MNNLISLLFFCLAITASAQIPTPGETPGETVVLLGGTAHIGNGEVMENAAIGMENGKITFVKPAGSIKLNADEVDIIDEIEPFSAGSKASIVVDLPPGKYALICNIAEIEDGELESHYQLGMYMDFEVVE